MPTGYINQIIEQFNSGLLDAATAQERLGISRAQLYRLRHEWLNHERNLPDRTSGGSRVSAWPSDVTRFIEVFLPQCDPLNYTLIAQELARRFNFVRSAAAVRLQILHHWPEHVPVMVRGPKPRRRWQCGSIGELLQHDSSPHMWWPDDRRQTLVLSIDDHSRRLLGGRFIPVDKTWDHFLHFRECFMAHGLPRCVYTDGLSLFGHESCVDDTDIVSQFQRALVGLGVAHRVAPDPQAKGKIERRFGFFQNRLPSLFRMERIQSYEAANAFLPSYLAEINKRHVCRITNLTAEQSWEKALAEGRTLLRPSPSESLLDLHLAHHINRRVNADHTVDFLGQPWPIAPTPRKRVTIIFHPGKQFWVITQPPTLSHPQWSDVLAHHTIGPVSF